MLVVNGDILLNNVMQSEKYARNNDNYKTKYLESYYIELDDQRSTSKKVFTRIYSYPDDRKMLISDLRNEAFSMYEYAEKLEEAGE